MSPYQGSSERRSPSDGEFAKDETPERGNPGGPVAIAFVSGASVTASKIRLTIDGDLDGNLW